MVFPFHYTLTLNRVHDTVRIKESDQSLILTVDADAMRLVAALRDAQSLAARYADQTEGERLETARAFSEAIFGPSQTERLMAFYRNDAGCVVSVCAKYFAERLNKLITRAQKRAAKKRHA